MPEILAADRYVALAQQTTHPREELDGKARKTILRRCQAYLKEATQAGNRWRAGAEEAWDLYDGNQWKAADAAMVKARQQVPITMNETTRTIDLILGLQAVQPMDWLGRPMAEDDNDAAEIVTNMLKFLANLNHSKGVFNDAYRDSLVYGVGWIRVGLGIRDPSPKAEPVQFMRTDPRDILPDPKSRERDYCDARFLIHRRRVSLEAARWLAKKYGRVDALGQAEMVDVTKLGEQTKPGVTDLSGTPPLRAWEDLEWNQAEKANEWRQGDEFPEGRDVWINELWERYTEKALLAWPSDGLPPVELDLDDPAMVEAVATDAYYQVTEEEVPRARFHIWTGDLLLAANQTLAKLDTFPFVPIWCARDKHYDPKGLVHQMKDPQSELNHRRSRLLWALLARRSRISRRVLERMGITLEEAQELMGRPDAMFEAEPNEVELLPNVEMPGQMFELMQDARLAIYAAAGITQDVIGQQTSSRSGVAKEMAASQGQLSLRPKEASLRFAHKRVGELLLHLAQHVHTGPWAIRVTNDVGAAQWFQLNKLTVDPATGQTYRLNDIRSARVDIEIDDTAWSPTMQARASQILLDLVGQIPDPGVRMKVMALSLLAGDIPKKKQVLDIIAELLQPKSPILPTPRPPTTQVHMDELLPSEQAQLVRRAGLEPDPMRGQTPEPPGVARKPDAGEFGAPESAGPMVPLLPPGMEEGAPPWATMVPGGVPEGGIM